MWKTAEAFQCYKCTTTTDEADDRCNDVAVCHFPQCAKVKYEDQGKVYFIRECAPRKNSIADDICLESESLKGKPCRAWLCQEPLCNGAEQLATVNRASSHTVMTALLTLLYFAVYG